MADLSIGDLSRCTGVKVTTIRYYETIGLVPEPARTEGRQRRYPQVALARLRFIRQARALGFETSAVRELLALSAQPDRSCVEVDRIARGRVEDIERRIAQLAALQRELRQSLDTCGRGRIGECRVLEALADRSA